MATGRLGLVGAWLIALYVVTIATALMTFSAFQFQTALGSIEASGDALTIEELESERKSSAAHQELIDTARKNIATLEATLLWVAENKNRARANMFAVGARSSSVYDEALIRIGSVHSTILRWIL